MSYIKSLHPKGRIEMICEAAADRNMQKDVEQEAQRQRYVNPELTTLQSYERAFRMLL